MATYFVKSGGDNGAAGTAWDTAWATIAYAENTAVSGDIIAVDSTIEESASSNPYQFGDATTDHSPKVFISAVAGSSGTTITYSGQATSTNGAKFTNSNNLQVIGCVTFYGFRLINSTAGIFTVSYGADRGPVRYVECYLSAYARFAQEGTGSEVHFENCEVIAGSPGSDTAYRMTAANFPRMLMKGGSFSVTTGNSSGNVFTLVNGANLDISGCDLSNINATTSLVNIGDANYGGSARVSGCKLKSSWTTTTACVLPASYILVERSSSAARSGIATGLSHYRTVFGTIEHNTDTYRTGGASDGSSNYSWKFTGSGTYCNYYSPLSSTPITVRCPGDNTTVYDITIHFGYANAGVTDADIWFDVMYPNSTTSHQDGFVSNRPSPGAAGTAYDSGGTWTGDGAANTYSKTFSITPYYPGPLQIITHVASASTPFYVCPKIDIAAAS